MLNIRTLIRPAAALIIAAAAAGAMAADQTLAVSILGPGGHSNGNYGNVNAVHAAARSIMLIEKAAPDAVVSDIQGGNSSTPSHRPPTSSSRSRATRPLSRLRPTR